MESASGVQLDDIIVIFQRKARKGRTRSLGLRVYFLIEPTVYCTSIYCKPLNIPL